MQSQTIQSFIEQAKKQAVEFTATMTVIEENYRFTETEFTNGNTVNAAGSNNGSCKLFAFAQMNGLDEQTTLNLFGDYYTKDVLQNPEGVDHQNIRNFMQNGWQGIEFKGKALEGK